MVDRTDNLAALRRDLRRYPVVAILGPRQIGKTTLAREMASTSTPAANYFDLEDPADLRRLVDADGPGLRRGLCRAAGSGPI